MEAEKYHIMMFPWLAFGHMLPYFEFSKRLAAKGVTVSYVSTPRNLHRLPPIPSALQPKMKLVEIQMQPVDGLPDNCEATVDLQNEQVPFLKMAYDTLAHPFELLLQNTHPHFILLDFAPYWMAPVAAKFGIPTVYFSAFTAAALAFLGSPAELQSVKSCPTPEMNQSGYVTGDVRDIHVPDASGVSVARRFGMVLDCSSFVLVRTCNEFEEDYIQQIQELYQKPVLPIGVLPPIPQESNNTSTSSSSDTIQWLDGQKPKSVLFVGFGSEYKMPLEQIHELAFSLELSRLPFVWILRQPQGVDGSDLLPPGFAGRTQSRGVVVLGWAPQQEILAHPAIGGCLFHSGWGTAVEALVHGHPLVLLPMVADQGLTARLLVEKQVGYEVPGRGEDGSFSREMVVESIRRVVVEEEGEQLRLKAAEMSRVFGDHATQDNYINKFIEHLKMYHDINGINQVSKSNISK